MKRFVLLALVAALPACGGNKNPDAAAPSAAVDNTGYSSTADVNASSAAMLGGAPAGAEEPGAYGATGGAATSGSAAVTSGASGNPSTTDATGGQAAHTGDPSFTAKSSSGTTTTKRK